MGIIATRSDYLPAISRALPRRLMASLELCAPCALALTPVLVSASLGIAGAILLEAGLSFLGLGVQPPWPSWGNILTLGKDNIEIAWWLSVFPGLAILITVLSYNLVGEGLRDALDPRLWDMEI